MMTRQLMNNNRYKMISAMYLLSLNDITEYMEFCSHLDFQTMEKLYDALRYSLSEWDIDYKDQKVNNA